MREDEKGSQKSVKEQQMVDLADAQRAVVTIIAKKHQDSIKFTKDPNVSMADKITRLKKLVHERTNENNKLITQQNKFKADCERLFALTKKAQEYKPPPKPKPKPKKPQDDFLNQLGQGPVVPSTAEKVKKEQTYQICACGGVDPEFKGYCQECVKKMKAKYDYLHEKFTALNSEYEEYSKVDLNKINDKMEKLRNKMHQYGSVDVNKIDITEKMNMLGASDESKEIAELKVQAQSLAMEIKIKKA